MRRFLAFLSVIIAPSIPSVTVADVASVMPHFYAEPGFHDKWRQSLSTINEHVDPFGGSLQISHVDLVVPGNGGLDIRIQRHYTSNIWLTRESPYSLAPYPTVLAPNGPTGIGWTMHFGRIIKSEGDGISDTICYTNEVDPNDTTRDNAVLELPDGSTDILLVNRTFSDGVNLAVFSTKKGWVANCMPGGLGLFLYSPDGLRYTVDHRVTSFDEVTYTTRRNRAWYPSKIEDANGNFLTITYAGQKGSHALIDRITASDGRVVVFAHTDGYVTSITANSATAPGNQVWTYEYQPVAQTGRKQLTRVTRPDGLRWDYTYQPDNAAVGRYAMQSITYPYGGVSSYTYAHVDFTGEVAIDLSKYFSVAVATKTQAGRGVEEGTWTYAYGPGSDTAIEPPRQNDVTTVTFPGGRHVYKHYGIQRQRSIFDPAPRELWKTGFLKEKEIYNLGSGGAYALVQREVYEWQAPGAISFEKYAPPPFEYVDQNVYSPELMSKTIERDGTVYKTEYNYDCSFPDGTPARCVKPKFKRETGQLGGVNEIVRQTDLYWYPPKTKESATPGVWKFDQILHEVVNGSNALGTLREFDYATGNLLGIEQHGVVTRYTYHPSGDIATKTNARGWVVSYNNYFRGVPRQEIAEISDTESTTVTRTVNDTGTVASETNGRGFVTRYQYDLLNRPTLIDKPIGADTPVAWDATGRTVTRGAYRERTEYDGFGRALCVDVADTARSEHVTQTTRYDALGRKSFASLPFNGDCTNPAVQASGDSFATDVLGRVTRVTHADNTFVATDYRSGNQAAVTNERGRTTVYTHRAFGDPDNADERVVMRVDTPENSATVFARNVLGQVVTASQGNAGGSVTRSYTYDPNNNFLLTATNPEIGTTTYTRDGLGNMKSRTVNGSPLTNYFYDGLNRLRTIDHPGTVPDVSLTYDANNNPLTLVNRLTVIPPAQGESFNATRTYTYDENDNLKTESLRVLRALHILTDIVVTDDRTLASQYDYTALDQLASIAYPSGNVVAFSPDALGWARQAGPYVTAVNYHPTGQPSSIAYANGRTTTIELNNRHWTQRITTSSGVEDLSYTYDGRGNVLSITNGINASNNITLDYDGLDRLTTANGIWGNGTVGYDAVGNIRSKVLGTDSLNYNYDNANRLTNIGGSRGYNFTYDVYGNVVSNNRSLFTYDDANNLVGVSGEVGATYHYDGKNLRVREEKNSTVTHYFYAKNGQLLGEYDRDRALITKEYVYLGGKLIAMVKENDPPVANAGADRTVGSGVSVTLSGSGSDPDGGAVSFQWTQVAGPAVTLTGAASTTASFTTPTVSTNTTLSFQLMVTDGHGATAVDTVDILISTTLPPPVWTLLAFPGDGQVRFTWQSVQGPPSAGPVTYNLYWSTTPGVVKTPANRLANVASPFIHTGRTNGTTYYYIITAQNNDGESASSPEAAVAPSTNGWTTPALLETNDTQSASDAALLLNGSGQAMALWFQSVDPQNPVMISSYQPGSTWTVPVVVPQIKGIQSGMDGNGNVIAVWRVGDPIYASRYVAGVGWGTAVPVSTVNTEVHRVQESSLAVAPNGNAMLVWREFCCAGSGFWYIRASRYDAATNTWSPPVELNFGGTTGPRSPQVYLDDNGNAVVVWERLNNALGVSARVYTAATNSWGLTTTIDSQGSRAVAAMSPNGTAMVVYKMPDQSLWAKRFAGTSWSAASKLPDSELLLNFDSAQSYRVLMDASGNAIASWSRQNASHWDVHAIRYTAGGGWDAAAARIGRIDGGTGVQLAMQRNGDAIAGWNDQDGFWANRYRSGAGWGVPLRVTLGVQVSAMAMDGSGNAIVTGTKTDPTTGRSDLYVSHFTWFGSAAPVQNSPPNAYAGPGIGPDEGTTVVLDASGSFDYDGEIVGYAWTQIEGPSVALTNANSARATFVAPEVSESSVFIVLQFRVTVTDNHGATSSDTVRITPRNVTLQSPVNVVAKGRIRQVVVTWVPWAANASRFNLYWSTMPGVTPATGTKIENVTSPFVHTGITPGVRNHYVVTAVDAEGRESPISAEVGATPAESLWGIPALVSAALSNQTAEIRVDGNGDAVAVWAGSASSLGIYAARYTAATGWTAPQMISSSASGIEPRLAVDAGGNATVIWRQHDGVRYNVWANRYSAGSGWGVAQMIEALDGPALNVRISMDASGNATAAWLQNDGSAVSVYANRYTAGTGWGTPALLESELANFAFDLEIAGSANGDAVVAWRHTIGGIYGVWTNRYRSGTGWEGPQHIGVGDRAPSIAMDAAGNAVVGWGRFDSAGGITLYANRYTVGSGWGTAAVFDTTGPGILQAVSVCMSPNGNAIIAWSKVNQVYQMYADRYVPGTGWVGAQSFGDPGIWNQCIVDDSGNGLVLWEFQGSAAGISAKRYRAASGGWAPTELVADETVSSSNKPSLALDIDGNVFAAWDGVYVNRTQLATTAPANTPPTANAGANQTVNEYGAVTLNGGASTDAEAPLNGYLWRQTAGPSVTLAGANTAIATFTAPEVSQDTALSFALTVVDYHGATATAATNVTVRNINAPPTANAGADRLAGANRTATLDGSASNDSDGTITAYQWKQLSGIPVGILNSTSAVATFTTPLVSSPTPLVFELKVTDNVGATASATTTVTVSNVNQPPIVNAGPAQTVNQWDTVILTGSGVDADGTVVSYEWVQIAGPAVTLLDASTTTPSFTAPQVSADTILRFRLTATDDRGMAATSTVDITVSGVTPAPRAPGISVAPGNAQNVIAWNSVAGASGYNIYWGTSTGVTPSTGTRIGGVATPYTHTGLSNGTRYYYVVTAQNAVGESPPSSELSTIPGLSQWSKPRTVAVGAAREVRIATNASGAGVAIWNQWSSETTGDIWIARHDGNGVWQAPARVLANRSDLPGMHYVAIDANGNAIALWAMDGKLYATRASAGGAWSTPAVISGNGALRFDDGGDIADRYIAMDPGGNAMAVWRENGPAGGGSGITSYVKSARYNAGTNSWSAPATIETLTDGWEFEVQVVPDSGAGMFAVWRAFYLIGPGTFDSQIRSSRYDAGSGQWQPVFQVGAASGNAPAVSSDRAGNAIVVWETIDAADVSTLWARRTNATTGWSAAEQVAVVGWMEGYSTGMDASANAFVVWNQRDQSERSTLQARRYAAGSGWGATVQIGDRGNDYSSLPPVVAVDSLGNAAVMWYQRDWGAGLWASYYLAGSGWQGAQSLRACNGATSCDFFDLAGASATAIAVWSESEASSGGFVSARYTSLGAGFPSANLPPRVYAGPLLRINERATVVLEDAEAVDPEATALTYSWTQVYGTPVTINSANTLRASVVMPSIDVDSDPYVGLLLTVTDAAGAVNSDLIDIEILELGTNSPPTANAGADRVVNPGSVVTLTGTGTDPGGSVASYQWVQYAGPAATLANPSAAATAFTAPAVTATTLLKFRLTVTDNLGAMTSDSVAITVRNLVPPTANAGPDQAVDEGLGVTLSGSGTDTDGTIASYQWAQTAGPTVTLSGANTATATFTAPQVTANTVLTFRLTVTDNDGATGSDTVNVTSRNTSVTGRDLVMTVVSTTATSVNVGTSFTITNTVRNQGTTNVTTSFSVRLFLSTDPTITATDTVLATRSVASLNAGASNTANTSVTVPATLAPGTYYIGAIADSANTQAESNETNNALAGTTIQVIRNIDLTMTALSTTTTTVNRGATMVLANTVRNQGTTNTTAAFSVGLYLSTDPTITTGDTLLTSRSVASLAAGANSAANTTVTIPATLTPGTYYIGAIADSANTNTETDETNNARTGTTVVVHPIDLTMTALSTTTTTVNRGATMVLANTVRNQGTAATTGAFTVRFYLSTDPTITTGDLVLGSRSVTSLAAATNSAVNTTVTVPAGTPVGTYFIGAIADDANTNVETNEANNTRATATTVQVQ